MSEDYSCFRCGESLKYLSLPFSRRDECRACAAPIHVCRMCVHFDTDVPKQCREDDAEEVNDKEKTNFCEWFQPAAGMFDAVGAQQSARARSELDALFGDGGAPEEEADPGREAAEDLFR